MNVQFKLEDVSKNIARFVAVSAEDEGASLEPGGAPNYGQADFVVQDEDDLEELRENIGKVFDFEIEVAAVATAPAAKA